MMGKKAKELYLGGQYVGGHSKCAHTHPPLNLGNGRYIRGGVASNPLKKDLDVYVSLDGGSSNLKLYPWDGVTCVCYPISDMQAPSDPKSFVAMIHWICERIRRGKRVHVGCIGGHGRTGMVLSAVVKVILGVEDAITYVRENYCDKAVETQSQIDFLVDHFAVAKVKGTKVFSTHKAEPYSKTYEESFYGNDFYKSTYGSGSKSTSSNSFVTNMKDYIPRGDDKIYILTPAGHKGNIWGIEPIDK